MAGTRLPITIEVDDAEVRASFARLVAAVGDPSPALREIGEHLLKTTRARFGQGAKHGPDGTPWARNTPAKEVKKTVSPGDWGKLSAADRYP